HPERGGGRSRRQPLRSKLDGKSARRCCPQSRSPLPTVEWMSGDHTMTDSIAASDGGMTGSDAPTLPAKTRRRPIRLAAELTPYLQATPLALILIVFLLIPIVTIVVVSFWD